MNLFTGDNIKRIINEEKLLLALMLVAAFILLFASCGEFCKDGHTVSEWITDEEATCTEDGIKHRECTECGAIFIADYIPATGHTSSEWIVDKDATCTVAGSKHKECTECGETPETEIIPTAPHTESDWIVDRDPERCISGTKHKECTVCGNTIETESIPAPKNSPMKTDTARYAKQNNPTN